MLRQSVRRWAPSGRDGRHRYVLSLPLDVVLRRMQSSSLTNPARGLEAHFQVEDNSAGDRGPESTASSRATDTPAPTPLRASLSQRLLRSLRAEDAARSPPPRLRLERVGARPLVTALGMHAAAAPTSHPGRSMSLDEVSLILANAIRHGLSDEVVLASFTAFADQMDERHRAGRAGGGGAGGARNTGPLFDGIDGFAHGGFRKAEALTRVLESCVAASEVSDAREGDLLGGLTVDMWASLTGWTLELWEVLASSISGACLLLEFYAVALVEASSGVRPRGVAPRTSGPAASTGAASRGASLFAPAPAPAAGAPWGGRSLLSLQTDPLLLGEHCYRQCARSLEVVLTSLAEEGEAWGTPHPPYGLAGGGGGGVYGGPPPSPGPPPPRGALTGRPPHRLLSRPAELVRLSDAVRHLLTYEAALHLSTSVSPPTSPTPTPVGPLTSSSSSSSNKDNPTYTAASVGEGSTAAAAATAAAAGPPPPILTALASTWRWWQGGRRRRGYRAAVLQPPPPPPLSYQVGLLVAAHVGPAPERRGGGFDTAGPRRPLRQLAMVFTAIVDTVPVAATTRVSLLLSEALRRERESGGGGAALSPETLAAVVGVGEACVRNPDGTQEVLAEVLKCLASAAPVLVRLGFDERHAGAHVGVSRYGPPPLPVGHSPATAAAAAVTSTATWALWPRACQLTEEVPLTLRRTAEQTLAAFTEAFLRLPEGSLLAAPPGEGRPAPVSHDDPSCPSRASAPYRHGRYGALLLACQLLRRGGGGLSPAMAHRIGLLVAAYPFTGGSTVAEVRLEARAVVRALHVLAVADPPARLPPWGAAEGAPLLRRLLRQFRCLVGEAPVDARGAPLGLEALTAAERVLLREAVRALQAQAQALPPTGTPHRGPARQTSGSVAAADSPDGRRVSDVSGSPPATSPGSGRPLWTVTERSVSEESCQLQRELTQLSRSI